MRVIIVSAALFLAFSAGASAQSYIISTVAGGSSGDGGLATSGGLGEPFGATVDSSGDLYIADYANHRIRQVAAATGIITTVAGNGAAGFGGDGAAATSATLGFPYGVAVDSSGNLYIADSSNNRIRKVTAATGVITTVAGNGISAYSGDGGAATSASLVFPEGVAVDSSGNLYIADSGNNVIRKVTAATGIITTVAGNGTAGFGGDGSPATSAQLNQPFGLAADSSGNLYFADSNNNRVRKVTAATGVVTTVAGNGAPQFSGDGGAATSAGLSAWGVAVDSSGSLYIADPTNSSIRKVTAATGIISTVAGNRTQGFAGDGGAATNANLASPYGVAVDSSGSFYIADSQNNRIRQVAAATGIITTVAGGGNSGDGGTATSASLVFPDSVAVDSAGNLFIADLGNKRIRQVTAATGIVSTVAGNRTSGFSQATNGDGGAATGAILNSPYGITVDSTGNLYITDFAAIRKVTAATGIITTVAGNGISAYSGDGGAATSAGLVSPEGVTADSSGNLYIADTLNQRIRKVAAATGIIITVAGNGSQGFSGDGGTATSASLNYPYFVALDQSGNLYIADTNNQRIRQVAAGTGIITTVAGNGTAGFSGDGGAATSASLLYPSSVAADSSGNLYIADKFNNRIRMVAAATGTITTIAGNRTQGFGGDGGAAAGASLSEPQGVALDTSGNLYIADSANNRIRQLTPQVSTVRVATNPPGLNLTIDGTVTGTPQTLSWVLGSNHTLFAADQTAASGLRYTFSSWSQGGAASQTVTVSGAATYTANFQLLPPTVSCPLSSTSVPTGSVYTINCTAAGGVAPFTWSIASGTLPNGLALNSSTGVITGTPTTVGLYSFTVQAVDSNSPAQTGTLNLAFSVGAPQTISFGALPDIPVSTTSFNLTATASSSQPVQYVSNTTAVCTVSGSTVTILISGGCSITASQPGNASYAAATPVTQAFTVLFLDVGADGSVYYSAAVNLLAQHGITAGCGSNNYCATQNVTREQMAIFMVRAIEGSDNFTFAPTSYFADVPSGAPGFKWIQKMFELGITGGCSNVNGVRNYCPNDNIPRNQMAIFLMRVRYGTAGAPDFPATPYFTDEPATDTTYFKWIQRMKLDGITGGCSTSTYCPGSPVIRGDMAIFVMRGAFNQLLPTGTAVIASISPPTLAPDGSGTFTVTGTNTHFVQGTTTISPIPGVTVGTVTVTSPTVLTVQLTAAATATTQPYSVLAITGTEEAVLPNGLTIAIAATGQAIGKTNQFEYLPADLMGTGVVDTHSEVSDNGHEFAGDNNSVR
jgi:sugar lactone lactonase YvrE